MRCSSSVLLPGCLLLSVFGGCTPQRVDIDQLPPPADAGAADAGSGEDAGDAGIRSDAGGEPDASTCEPHCGNAQCGDDGCGGSCGACDSAPAATCASGSVLTTYTNPGSCVAGQCTYPPGSFTCPEGCAGGACQGCTPHCGSAQCGSNGCGGSCGSCDTPPAAACSSTTALTTYPAAGYCSGGQCAYAPTTTACSHGCLNGACESCTPHCSGLQCGNDGCGGSCGTCDAPPAATCASASVLTTYAAAGTCSGGGQCSYTPTSTSCEYGCANGACQACAPQCGTADCGSNGCGGSCGTCDTAPAAVCTNSTTLETFSSAGTCNSGHCSYTSTSATCAHGCANGACENCTPSCGTAVCGSDGCGGSCGACDTPPAATCTGETLTTFATAGTCTSGACGYTPTSTVCSYECSAGACVSCTPNCTAQRCGSNGCNGQCATCPSGTTCGGNGVAGLCGAAEPGAYPGVTAVQIASTTPIYYLVAPDEKHVAMLLLGATSCNNPIAGPLVVATLGSTGTWTTQMVAPLVATTVPVEDSPAIAWTPDGTHLIYAYTTGANCVSPGNGLYIADADGTGSRQLATSILGFSMGGESMLIDEIDYGSGAEDLYYVSLPSGTPELVAGLSNNNATLYSMNPSGTAYLFDTFDTTYSGTYLVQTSAPTTVTDKLDNGLDFWGLEQWSPDGTQFAFATAPSNSDFVDVLTMQSNGTGEVGICSGGWSTYAPDSRFACGSEVEDDTTAGTLVIGNGSGTPTTLTLPYTGGSISNAIFSANSAVVYAAASSQTTYYNLVAASTTADATFTNLSVALPSTTAFAVTAAGDHVAAAMGTPTVGSEVDVFPPTSGSLERIPTNAINTPAYEQSGAGGLLVLDALAGTAGSLQLWSADGSSRTAVLPGQVPATAPTGWNSPYQWVGTAAVYAVADSASDVDLVLANDTGTTAGVVGSEVTGWQAAPIALPTRIFFTQSSKAGLWTAPLP